MMSPLASRRITAVSAAFAFGVLLMLAFYTGVHFDRRSIDFMAEGSNIFSAPHRKLLHRATVEEPNRAGVEGCSKNDIVITQGPTAPLPSGIPTYTVEIMNVCVSGCAISAIHLSCGWFSSARLINPLIFKRLDYDDCLVNDGRPLVSGDTVSFEYANSFPYKLTVSSIVC